MKKIIISLGLILVWYLQINAQTVETNCLSRNELKLDVAYILAFMVKVEYEYLLNDWSSVGAVGFINTLGFLDNNYYPLYQTQLLGFYRLFLGNKPAAGLFFEGNTGLTSGYRSNYMKNPSGKYFAPCIGIALGWKYVSQKNLVFDLFLGFGKIYGNSGPENYPRLGICFGKRF